MQGAAHANGGLTLESRELHPAGSGEVPDDRPGDEAQDLKDQSKYHEPAADTTAGLGALPDLDQLGPPGRLELLNRSLDPCPEWVQGQSSMARTVFFFARASAGAQAMNCLLYTSPSPRD